MTSKATTAARILLGLVFLVFGLNGFLPFLPQPQMVGKAGEFVGGLVAAGYIFPLLFVIYTATGVALLSGRFVPLALTILAPVVVNIVAVHVLLDPSGIPLAVLTLGLEVYLAWAYRVAFRPLLRSRHELFPATSEPTGDTRAVAHAN
jgi:hypothetical protein